MPQQTNPGRQKKLGRIVRQFELGMIDFERTANMASKDAFTDVVPRFHNIRNDSDFASDYFYKTDCGKNLIFLSQKRKGLAVPRYSLRFILAEEK